jgi:hypothetical protein
MSKTLDSGEILRLRKELIHARTQVADLQEEMQEKMNLYMNAVRVSTFPLEILSLEPFPRNSVPTIIGQFEF